jgi:septum formation protein
MISSVDGKVFRNVESLVLASGSARRRELLLSMGLTFDIVPSEIEEVLGEAGDVCSQVERCAMKKALAISRLRPDCWVLGADTIVVVGEKVLGKPASVREAVSMLEDMSGKTHQVITALCLAHHEREYLRIGSVITKVTFKELSGGEIRAYVAAGESLDKAGGYGIQGKAAFLVRSVEGSYTNVVGLPLCEILEWLLEEGVVVPAVGTNGDER